MINKLVLSSDGIMTEAKTTTNQYSFRKSESVINTNTLEEKVRQLSENLVILTEEIRELKDKLIKLESQGKRNKYNATKKY